jgi:prepilin-type N-terminal cleavage/methylation domain-containing protein
MRLDCERGLTLVELIVGMAISTIVLGATLTTFNTFYKTAHDNDARNDATELARNALDVQARQLRNLAKRVASPVIDTLGPYNLIFQTSDPNRTWVRYCLNTTTPPASPNRGRLWTGELEVASASTASPVTAAMRSGCPGTGWTRTSIVTDYVTNVRAGFDRPVLEYTCIGGATCPAGAAGYDQVVGITAQLLVDTTPGTGPAEMRVMSGVFLRNQNQAPVASFDWTRASTSRTLLLNAAGSSDYEGRTLDYYWFEQIMPAVQSIDCSHPTVTGLAVPRTLWGAAGFLGEGVALTRAYAAADGASGTPKKIGLVVCDPGDRYDTVGVWPQAPVTVAIPT